MHIAIGELFEYNKEYTKFNIALENIQSKKDELLEEKEELELKVAHLVNEKFKLSIDLKLVADD